MNKPLLNLTAFCILLTLLISSCGRNTKTDFDIHNNKVRSIISELSDTIRGPKFFPDNDVRAYLHKEFNQFYKERNYDLAWLDFEEPLAHSQDLLEAIDNADKEGLDPENYNLPQIESLLKEVYKVESRKEKRKHKRAKKSYNKEKAAKAWEEDSTKLYDLVKLDFLMTSSYLTYASHLLSGKINPNEKELWYSKPRKRELANELSMAIKNNSIKESLENLLPKHPQYALLKKELQILLKAIATDSFPTIEADKKIKLTDSGPVQNLIAKKLQFLGDLNNNPQDGVARLGGLKHFQSRNGLTVDGNLTVETVSNLNIPVRKRLETVKVNMERMRWLPDNFGERYVLVNIPEYKLRIYENLKNALEMKVIVGNNYKQTPVFSDTMEYIVFNPTWTVPNEIGVEEFVPHLKKDPSYLDKKGFLLYDSWKDNADPIDAASIEWTSVDSTNYKYRIVQKPGKDNSLGMVKFIFPNAEDIYLHDTPAHNLFNTTKRGFSHGCIRLEKPIELAEYLLKDKGLDKETFNKYLEVKDKPENVNLPKKTPVHLVYWTAWVDDNGILNFRDDIYKHDQKQESAIKMKNASL